MISLRLRAIILFVFSAIFMWFTMAMVAQQLFIFRKHRSNLNPGDQGVLQGKDVHVAWRVSKNMKTDSRTVGRDTNHAKWNGFPEEKFINDGTQRRNSGKVRLLCWVMTSPQTLGTKAERVARTWAKKCSQTLFMSSQNNTTFPGKVIGLNVMEGRNALWNKTRLSLKYIYDHHFDEADWFFKADDDTYVIVENLMAFLSEQDPNKPVFFGFNFVIKMPYYHKLKRIEYMSGGAGYALSREALKRFVEVGLKEHPRKCPHKLSDWPEDVNLGICMESLGVLPGDTRDQWGRFRFIPTNLHYFVDESVNEIDWLRLYSKYNISVGRDCCSDSLISFHYVQPGDMVIFDFLVNNVKVDPRDL